MEQGFPIELYTRATNAIWSVHLIFTAMIAIAIIGMIVTWRKKPSQREVLWSLPALFGPLVGHFTDVWSCSDPITMIAVRSIIYWYILAVIVIGSVGFARSLVRLRRVKIPIGWDCLLLPICTFGWFWAWAWPGVSTPSPVTRRVACRNNLKQVGLALHNYNDAYSRWPPSYSSSPAVSWRVLVLPFLGESDRYKQYDQTKAWKSSQNLPMAGVQLQYYRCPSNPHPHDAMGRYYSDYVMLTGPGSIGGNPAGTKFGEIRDGTSNTIAVTEACGLQIVWTEPRDCDVSTQPLGINLKGTGVQDSSGMCSSYHGFGAFVLMADGSVRSLSQSIDPELLRKMSTIAGDEKIEEEF